LPSAGTSSGLGKETAKKLLATGKYFTILAVRDTEKMKQIAEKEGFDPASYAILELDLASFASTKKFVTTLQSLKSRPIDHLVCNAAVYQPALPTVSRSTHYPLPFS
jgi:protochlorophyllide reductase